MHYILYIFCSLDFAVQYKPGMVLWYSLSSIKEQNSINKHCSMLLRKNINIECVNMLPHIATYIQYINIMQQHACAMQNYKDADH